MKHRWRFTGRSAIHHIIHATTGDVGPPSYTVGFVCAACGIHWNSWARFVDGAWEKSKATNHGERRYFPVLGRECDPLWRIVE